MPKTNDFKVFESKKIQGFKQNSQILLRSLLTEGKRTLDLIINTVFRNCIKKNYLINHVSYETTGRMIPSRTNTPPAEESTR